VVSVEVKYTICIPTLNAAGIWQEFWKAVEAQTVKPHEVVVLDSTSDDGTCDLAVRAGCRVITVSRKDFRHGGTRQFAAEIAGDVDVLVYLTQDSILASATAIESLLTAFDHPDVGAAFGRQLPRPDANPIAAHARLFNYPAVSSFRSMESVTEMGFKAIFFSNSFGAYRRRALFEVGGFPLSLNFGEDTVLAARMILAGYKIAYQANAQAFHSHDYTCLQEYRRAAEIGRFHESESWLLDAFGTPSREGRKFVVSEFRYLLRRAPWLIPEAMLRTGIKYAGYRTSHLKSAKATR